MSVSNAKRRIHCCNIYILVKKQSGQDMTMSNHSAFFYVFINYLDFYNTFNKKLEENKKKLENTSKNIDKFFIYGTLKKAN